MWKGVSGNTSPGEGGGSRDIAAASKPVNESAADIADRYSLQPGRGSARE